MTTVTSKQKKEAIEALFNSSKDTVVGDTFKFLLWTHNKGLYSGFSKVASRHNRVKYYGFVIDLVHHKFFMEGVSGKHLANNSSNLKEVFANGKPFSDDYLPNPNSSMEVFKCAGQFLGDAEWNEQSNFGRGIYRLINEYPVLELLVKEYYPKNLSKSDANTGQLWNIQQFFNKTNSSSIRKVLHRKIIYDTWKVVRNPIDFIVVVLDLSHGFCTDPELVTHLDKLAKLLEDAKKAIYAVDEERGYHDATLWYQLVSSKLVLEAAGSRYVYNHDLLNCIEYVRDRKGHSGIKNLFKYSYASLYHQQAFDSAFDAFRELSDYYDVTRDLNSVPLYPRYLKVAHDVASRNVRLLKSDVDNNKVIQVWKDHHSKLDAQIGNYIIYQALTPKEIVEEGTNNSNCVGGYVINVADGNSIILFLRNKENPTKSWVTLEVRFNHLVQAYATFDRPLDDEAQNILSSWCKSRGIGREVDLGGANTSDWDTRRVSSKVLPLVDEGTYHDEKVLAGIKDNLAKEKVTINEISHSVKENVSSFS